MSASIELLIKDHPHPHRSFALKTTTHVLILRHQPTSTESNEFNSSSDGPVPRCIVRFTSLEEADLEGYRSLKGVALNWKVHGTLGLITIDNDVFLCVVSMVAARPIVIRPGETVRKIESVDFHCLNSPHYDRLLNEQVNPYTTEHVNEHGFDERGDGTEVHPCLELKKLLSSGTFYYSSDFDLTRRMQKRITDDKPTISIESFDAGFLWNSYMIQPIMDFRSRLSEREKDALDASNIITSAIRGFCNEMIVPSSSSPLQRGTFGEPARLTLISRLSCRRAGTRFNARGMDDEGNVANYVESETSFWSPTGEDTGQCFSYVQVRGSLPLFWEQPSSLIPGQPKITITRSVEATQPAFDRHFLNMDHSYGAVHIVNLLADDRNKPGEMELTARYEEHIRKSALNTEGKDAESDHRLLKYTHYDFHAETKGPGRYEAARGIEDYIHASAGAFGYLSATDREEHIKASSQGDYVIMRRGNPETAQEGVFRTNCLDCLDRTNLIQTIVSQMALQSFFDYCGVRATPDFWARHGTLWADNGDSLSKIYAGTGALKSSFTRHGKMSLGGLLSDGVKSVTRHINSNFNDKGRQDTIDMLLGRNMQQKAVHLDDPINDWVQTELKRRAPEYSSTETVQILIATFNLNGKTTGINEDLSPWLCPPVDRSQRNPEIVAVAFQEIVELSPQQMMKEDPYRRKEWEVAVKDTLNTDAANSGGEGYVLLRSGQLVGAALLIFVKASVLGSIKNVEGAIKKTGISGLAGNKGAVAIRMDFDNTSLCFVTAHLAAGFANYEERNRDYRTISQGLRFQRNRTIDNHDSVIWAGDFNYRIGLSNEKVRTLIDRGDFDALIENDQLYLMRTRSGVRDVFDHYDEAKITFLPTYKYDLGTDEYDTSEKARIPAWTDRVLSKGNNLRQINYNSAPLRFSDHRPVYATFYCDVNMVDEKHREALNRDLYRKRQRILAGKHPSASVETSIKDDEVDLIEYEPTDDHWPPASSDRQKWWLDRDLPAQSALQAPGSGYVPNPNRPPNPFIPSEEPDWIKVDRPSRPPSSASRSSQSTAVRSAKSTEFVPQLPPRRPTNQSIDTPSAPSINPLLARKLSVSSVSSTQRKPAPPVPKKPNVLSTPTSPNINEERKFTLVSNAATPPTVPPPRRSMAAASSVALSRNASTGSLVSRKQLGGGNGGPPPLPKRTGTGTSTPALMDEVDGESMNGLRDWEVLKPG